MALPVGILVAIYLNEFAPASIRNFVTMVLDVLNGVPAIVIGIFVFGLLVVGHGQSGCAGAFALACLMLPLVARSTMEILALVPNSLREAEPRARRAAVAHDAQRRAAADDRRHPHRHRARGRARRRRDRAAAASSRRSSARRRSWNPNHALQTVPVAIFELSESPDPADHARAWAAALVLLLFILFTSLAARWLANRNRSKIAAR